VGERETESLLAFARFFQYAEALLVSACLSLSLFLTTPTSP
jgi:hypothetical protein